MPFSSLARLNGKPSGSPGPELIRLIVTVSLAEALTWASGGGRRHLRRRLVKYVGAGGEVQPRMTAAGGTEPQAGLERDVTPVEEQLAGLVVRAERGAVEPGQERRLGRVPGNHGQALAHQVADQGPPVVEGGEQLVEPGPAIGERGDGGQDAEMAGAPPGVLGEPVRQRGHARRGGDDGGALEPGQVP